MVDINTLIDVTGSIATGGIARRAFGRGLLVTSNTNLSAAGHNKAVLVNSAAEALALLGSGDDYDAAAVWFSADPAPQGLYVGRWASAQVVTELRGSTPAAFTSGALDASNGSLRINGVNVTGINLSSQDTGTNIATAVQGKIRAATGAGAANLDDAVVSFANGRFTLALTGPEHLSPGYAETATASVGTDISTALGWSQAAEPTYIAGSAQETIGAAVDAMQALAPGGRAIAVMLSDGVDANGGGAGTNTRNELAAHVQADGEMIYALLETSGTALTTNESTTEAAKAFAASQNRVAAIYSEPNEKPDVALMALMSGQDLSLPASIITAHAKTLPGVAASAVTAAQYEELKRKRTNVYTDVGGTPTLVGGYTSRGGHWLDAVWWLTWMTNELTDAIFNAQRGARRMSAALLRDTLATTLATGVRNGGIAPQRTVATATKQDIIATTGNADFDGVLTTGYLVWVDPAPTALDRDNRIGRFKCWAVGSEAIHEVFGNLTFTN